MTYRVLGNGHLTVSSIGLGCWGMSHAYGRADEKESLATLHLCLDLGINFLDTADVYGDGHNERLISRVLKSRRREAVVATKFGFVGDEHGRVTVNGRPEYVREACENSLDRLGIDEIDLYYLHRLDPSVSVEETVGAMSDLVREGKIRFIGLSEVSARTVRRAHAVHPITALQSEYSLWHREVEKEIFPVCRDLSVSLVPFSPLGRGFLTGAVQGIEDLENHDYRRRIPRFQPGAIRENRRFLEKIQAIADRTGISLSQLSLAWLLAQSDCLVPIPGMKQQKYVRENLAAVDISLPDSVIRELNGMDADICGMRHNPHNLQFIENRPLNPKE